MADESPKPSVEALDGPALLDPRNRDAMMTWAIANLPIERCRDLVARFLHAPDPSGDSKRFALEMLGRHPELVVSAHVRPLMDSDDHKIAAAAVVAIIKGRAIQQDDIIGTLLCKPAAKEDPDVLSHASLALAGSLLFPSVEYGNHLLLKDPVATALVVARQRALRGFEQEMKNLAPFVRAQLTKALDPNGGITDAALEDLVALCAEVSDAERVAALVDRVLEARPVSHATNRRWLRRMRRYWTEVDVDAVDAHFVRGALSARSPYEDALFHAERKTRTSAHAAFQTAWHYRGLGAVIDHRWTEWIASLGFADDALLAELARTVAPILGPSAFGDVAEQTRRLAIAEQAERAELWGVAAHHLAAAARTTSDAKTAEELTRRADALRARARAHVERVKAATVGVTPPSPLEQAKAAAARAPAPAPRPEPRPAILDAPLDPEAEAIWPRLVKESIREEEWDSEFMPRPDEASKIRTELVKLGKRAVPTLVRRTTSLSDSERLEAYVTLANLGAAASEAHPVVRAQLATLGDVERHYAERILGLPSSKAAREREERERERERERAAEPAYLDPAADLANARRFVRERLEEARRRAQEQASDPYWRSSGGNAQRWVAKAYGAALVVLAEEVPAQGETRKEYFPRVATAIRAKRDLGPDNDDEAWFSSAIDEAAAVVFSAS